MSKFSFLAFLATVALLFYLSFFAAVQPVSSMDNVSEMHVFTVYGQTEHRQDVLRMRDLFTLASVVKYVAHMTTKLICKSGT